MCFPVLRISTRFTTDVRRSIKSFTFPHLTHFEAESRPGNPEIVQRPVVYNTLKQKKQTGKTSVIHIRTFLSWFSASDTTYFALWHTNTQAFSLVKGWEGYFWVSLLLGENEKQKIVTEITVSFIQRNQQHNARSAAEIFF